MKTDLEELKYQVHVARVALAYQEKTEREERCGTRESQIAEAKARLDAAVAAWEAAKPEPVSMRVRSPYFIGPRKKQGKRGDGPTITCFRCEQEKPREQFYRKGTVCKECTVRRSAQWAARNPDRCAEIKKISFKQKMRNDPGFRVMMNCRRRLAGIMKDVNAKRGSHFSELIGTNSRGLVVHLSALFSSGMSWENYGWGPGKWVVDHITPARYFDHLIEEEIRQCWHYTNLRPMWWKENGEKSDILPCGRRARHVKILLTT